MALFRMEHKVWPTIRVFSIQLSLRCPTPRQEVIAAPIWHSIVSNPNNLVLCIHNAGSNLQGNIPKGLVTSSSWSATGEAVYETRGLQTSKMGTQLLEVLRSLSPCLFSVAIPTNQRKEHSWPQRGYKRQWTMAHDNLLSQENVSMGNAAQKTAAVFSLCKLTRINPVSPFCNLLTYRYLCVCEGPNALL